MTQREDLPTFLMKIRKRHGYSQSDVADVLGMNYSSYGKYESGQSRLKFEQAEILSEFYDIPITDFANRNDNILKVNRDDDGAVGRKSKVSIMVELDGSKVLLERALRVVNAVNESLSPLSLEG